MPLNALKARVATKAGAGSPGSKPTVAAISANNAGTRALYGCVAKKLVKIDRGGGEQVVKFD